MSHYSEIVKGWLWAGDLESAADGAARKAGARLVVSVMSKMPENVASAIRSGSSYFWLQADDDNLMDPECINRALWRDSGLYWFAGGRPGPLPEIVPTFIHCQLGQNRSTALAACWLAAFGLCCPMKTVSLLSPTVTDRAVQLMFDFREGTTCKLAQLPPKPIDFLTAATINAVSAKRMPDLAAIGRSGASVSDNMRANVRGYIEWLMRGCRPEWIKEGIL